MKLKNVKKTSDQMKIKSKGKVKKAVIVQNLKILGQEILRYLMGGGGGGFNVENYHAKTLLNLFELRQDPLIQDRVQQRLQELNQLVNIGDKKINSQEEGLMFL